MSPNVRFRRSSQADFAKTFGMLVDRYQRWNVWADFISLAAISLAARFDPADTEKYKAREKEYANIMSRYKEDERAVFPQLMKILWQALEDEPEQDFLGEMFMQLDLGNHWKGQFFTPYSLCQLMVEMTMQNISAHIDRKGWVGIYDPACGAGALLVAARNYMQNHPCGSLPGHQQALFVAQDLDRTAGLMCYLQLSLLGCAGYVVIGDTMANPAVGLGASGVLPIEKEGQDIWCMPMFHDRIWVMRQAILRMEHLIGSTNSAPTPDTNDAAGSSAQTEKQKKPEDEEQPMGMPMTRSPTAAGKITLF